MHDKTGHDTDPGHGTDGTSGVMTGHDMHHKEDVQMVMGCGRKCPFRELLEAAGMTMHTGMAIEFTCDPALDFVRGMIPHHEGALEMCKKLSAALTSIDAGLAHFCYHVDLEQSWETAGMKAWLDTKGFDSGKLCSDGSMGCGDLSCDSSKAFLAANVKMHALMAVNYSCDAELDFVQGMVPHHQGAVDMCAVLEASASEDAYLAALCQNITRLQNAEMAWMYGWLQKRGEPLGASCTAGAAVVEPCHDMLPISDLCHDLGGDCLCSCSNFVDHCGTEQVAQGRKFTVNEVCARSCGQCGTAKTSAEIVAELLQLGTLTGYGSTTTSTARSRERAVSAARRLGFLLPLFSLLVQPFPNRFQAWT